MDIATEETHRQDVTASRKTTVWFLLLLLMFFSLEICLFFLMRSAELRVLLVGGLFSLIFSGICIALPRPAARVFFAASWITAEVWGAAQYVYYLVFGKMMWLTDMRYTSDGAVYFSSILGNVPVYIWIFGFSLLAVSFVLVWRWPAFKNGSRRVLFGIGTGITAAAALLAVQSDQNSGPYRTMELYEKNGYYALTSFDLWNNVLSSIHPANESAENADLAAIDAWFGERSEAEENSMTGVFAGKDLVIVLMEAIDDWLITPEETPTLYALQQQGICFTEFYTPHFGTTRSINTQTCIDAGTYFPTDGRYFYDYLGNGFDHTLAARFKAGGYSAELFHHNWPDFYRRSELVPALRYDRYNAYVTDAGGDEWAAMNDEYLFDDASIRARFFRDGPTVNFVVTQAAHLPYTYNDDLSRYAFERYPSYRGKYSSEQEDCIRAKTRLVDDMVARLLMELAAEERLENTVILLLSDHYPYGYDDVEQMLRFSDATDLLMLEKTPCFLWAVDMEPMVCDKTLNTADILPTLLNLFDIPSEYHYLGQDAFDPAYRGCAVFADGSWASEGILCRCTREDGKTVSTVLSNANDLPITDEYLTHMAAEAERYIDISNRLLSADYYRIQKEEGA